MYTACSNYLIATLIKQSSPNFQITFIVAQLKQILKGIVSGLIDDQLVGDQTIARETLLRHQILLIFRSGQPQEAVPQILEERILLHVYHKIHLLSLSRPKLGMKWQKPK